MNAPLTDEQFYGYRFAYIGEDEAMLHGRLTVGMLLTVGRIALINDTGTAYRVEVYLEPLPGMDQAAVEEVA